MLPRKYTVKILEQLYFISISYCSSKNQKHVDKCILKRAIKTSPSNTQYIYFSPLYKWTRSYSTKFYSKTFNNGSVNIKQISKPVIHTKLLSWIPNHCQSHLQFWHFWFVLNYVKKFLELPIQVKLVCNFKWLKDIVVANKVSKSKSKTKNDLIKTTHSGIKFQT